MIKVLIVDDQKLLRESLKYFIEQGQTIEIIGSAESGTEAIELCEKLHPDLVLMDIYMPGGNGLAGTKAIKALYPEIKVLILTVMDDEQNIAQALESGADGYVLKDIAPEELIQVIHNVMQGFVIFSKKIHESVLRRGKPGSEGMKTQEGEGNVQLKEKELRILELIAEGKNYRQIATILYLSEGRIKNIISELLSRFNLKDRYELISYAYRNNLVK
ncbi:MAG TPA: response regulator transcription factor [Bacillota bacterium]|nr:response regulator transcription factor [Bacillota bacterium]